MTTGHFLTPLPNQTLPAINDSADRAASSLGDEIAKACQAWLMKSPSLDTRSNYERDIRQFLQFTGIGGDQSAKLAGVRPEHVAAWRDDMIAKKLTNSSIRRKMTALRSLFSYLQSYGYTGKNTAHGDLAAAPAAPRDGKTVGLSPQDCRRLLDAPPVSIKKNRSDGTEAESPLPAGIRDRAIFGLLAFTGCRVGELTRLRVGSYKTDGVHRVVEIHGKGGKERLVPLNPEAAERLEAWLDIAGIRGDSNGALFRPVKTARGDGMKGFAERPIGRRAVQKLLEGYVRRLKLDANVTVHSFRVTALTTAREAECDIIDLQDFAGHADPRTTLTYIRSRDRLSKSPAYVLRY
jgi:integrase/recombinase XerD